ncbi:MerR family transcriptional regulator [Limnoglobus roseus]|uniref:MerR family DNA-binding transcriptional regulator n=1 Tax=Limnoglobus roseus TaxID=2598579 RepID=A0A5C1A7W7_9BACT|nr:MerR family transcriptional regulator [Limnoglobus roseus]QEL15409.1 MerR family DNA-binding transcriptional regulator [Limnoglobus roseus]
MWKVGELARRSGVTVRTLHHYHDIGLLVPSGSTGAGHRLYTDADLAKLQQILVLRQLGLTLEQVGEYLTRDDYSPRAVIELRLQQLREQIATADRLRVQLEGLSRLLDRAEIVSAEQFLQTIEALTMIDKYYTPEQLANMQERYSANIDRIKEVEAEWPRLMAAVQAEMDKGTPPTDPAVQALAQKWDGLVSEFTGGDPNLQASLKKMYESEPTVAGMDMGKMRPMMEYVQRARTGE